MRAIAPNKIYFENHLRTIEDIDSSSIDMICTSPPYASLRTYNGYEFDFPKLAHGLTAILKPGGVIAWNVMDETVKGRESLDSCKQKIFFAEECGLWVHDTMIYQKLNFSHPETNRYHNTFEYVFIFSKGKPKTFNAIMDRPNKTAGEMGNRGINTFTLRDGSKSERSKKLTKDFGMRHNVWLGKTRGQEEGCKSLPHPAMMPKWLAHDLIISFSNSGDLIYDPMAGSGTVCEQAEKLGRRWLGSEISKKYA